MNGFRVELGEIEAAAMSTVPELTGAVATLWNNHLVLYVVRGEGGEGGRVGGRGARVSGDTLSRVANTRAHTHTHTLSLTHTHTHICTQVPDVPEVDGLKDKLRDLLPPHAVPAFVEALPFMPLNVSGKVDRSQLPEPHAGVRHTIKRGTSKKQVGWESVCVCV
jgi:hypothetical protein